jgi:peptide-methionine (S)-S-oxide reductase
MPMNPQTITLGGGCFWCLEAVFERVQGVLGVQSGYSNGHLREPSYAQVCGGGTGHAEVVRVNFDADVIPLRTVLEIFFHVHDPTTRNRQGNDIGTQYRSAIYWHDETQRALIDEVLTEAQRAHGGRVVTEVAAENNYWPAEDYHQHYFVRNPHQGYCAMIVAPKVAKFERSFRQWLRAA